MAKNEKQAGAASGTAVVTVALKHPTGIILQAYAEGTEVEPSPMGGREVKRFRPKGQSFALHGTRVPFGRQPNFAIIGGYALTPNIPKAVWENWLEHNTDSPLVQNRLISAFERLDLAKDWAKDNKDSRSGMEPLLRAKDGIDPRNPKMKNRAGKFVNAIVEGDTGGDGEVEGLAEGADA